eukprot:TRINITY_DN1034_c0_g3_i1.p1 TRINITY_DN1034_c0_g3~~TRINITY_DN1034_c0_g3_i1.p1  ORF type:complete len:200 (+),score=95.60 TRINITY_DN1034_c0_g3_i1:73-672(+)
MCIRDSGDIEKTEAFEGGEMAKTLPVGKKEEVEEKEMYLKELQQAYEQSKKYCEEAKDLGTALIDSQTELNECKKLLEMKDEELQLMNKFISKDATDQLEQMVKGMTDEIELLRRENTNLKRKKTDNPSELEQENEKLYSKIGELESEMKVMNEDRKMLIEGAKVKIDEERQRFLGLSKKLEDFQDQLLAARCLYVLTA